MNYEDENLKCDNSVFIEDIINYTRPTLFIYICVCVCVWIVPRDHNLCVNKSFS